MPVHISESNLYSSTDSMLFSSQMHTEITLYQLSGHDFSLLPRLQKNESKLLVSPTPIVLVL